MQEVTQAAQYGDDARLLEKVDVKCDLSQAEQQSTDSVRTPKQRRAPVVCIAVLLSLLMALTMMSALTPHRVMQWRPCHRGTLQQAQHAVTTPETDAPTFLEALQEASPESLHELLHKYFPEKFQHGVFPSDHHALEALHQADAAVASTIARMAKRADNTTATSVPSSTVFTSTVTSVIQSSTVVTTIVSTSSRAVTSTSAQTQSSSTTASSTSVQSSKTGMSTSQRGISSSTTPLLSTVTTSTSSAAQSSSVLSSSGGDSTTLSTTAAPTSSAPRSSTTRTSTFTSTNANGGVVVVTQTTVVGGDSPTDPAGVSSTQPAGGLQTNAALSPKERSGKPRLLWGAAIGLALLA